VRRSRSSLGLGRRLHAALMMVLAAFMLAAAPALASGPESHGPSMAAGVGEMHDGSGSCIEAGTGGKAMPDQRTARCLASCLAGMAVTSPAVPAAFAPLPFLRSNPECVDTGALVPHPLPVEPPPPRMS